MRFARLVEFLRRREVLHELRHELRAHALFEQGEDFHRARDPAGKGADGLADVDVARGPGRLAVDADLAAAHEVIERADKRSAAEKILDRLAIELETEPA